MFVYRAVSKEFSNIFDLVSGVGAELEGGRWNLPSIKAIYTTFEKEDAIAEKAFYEYTSYISATGRKNKFTKEEQSRINNVQFKLVRLQIPDVSTIDLSEETTLKEELGEWNLTEHSVNDARKSSYALLPERWTQRLGSFLIQSRCNIITPSARHSGRNLILNTKDIKHSNSKATEILDVILYPVDVYAKRWDGKKNIDLFTVDYEILQTRESGRLNIASRT